MGAQTNSPVPLIDEQVHDCKLELVEGTGEKKGRVFARGEFGHAVNPTANGRRYRHNIWESNISRLEANLKSRKVLGELDHPTDGRTALQRASHVITDLRLEGDQVMGEAEILDTATGRDLKAILSAGVPVGISSRGFGSTKPARDGSVEDVQDDYKLVTFDFVAEPADPTAYPEVVFESGDVEAGATMMFEGADLEATEAASEDDEDEGSDDDGEASDDPEATEDSEDPESKAPRVGSAPPGEAELARRFAQQVMADAEGKEVSVEDLRSEFAAAIVEHIASQRTEVEKQVRAEMAEEARSTDARSALESIRSILRPFMLTEDAQSLLDEREAEVAELRVRLTEAQETIEAQEGMIETLAGAAREAGYKYHLECLLHEEDADADRLRAIVGDVAQYDSPDALQERVAEAKAEMQAFRIEEERVYRQREAEADRLRGKNQELAEGLEQALVANRELALRVYAVERLQTHPHGAKILRMLDRSGITSKEQVDSLIEDFREPERDADDLESVRAQVRSKLFSGQEYLPEDAQPARGAGGGTGDYNGLGASLSDLKHLAGVRD